MQNYSFWADLFMNYRVSPDWIKALIVISPWASLIGVLALWSNFWLKLKKPPQSDIPPAPIANLYTAIPHQGGESRVLEKGRPRNLIRPVRVKPKTPD